jgi:Putative glycosyl/glycerophosphate transferases involved in teichoic acid biosynthesis TagF/TagB/EpsJ/RodC
MRVCFFYNAQHHQILHSLPMAFELSAMPGFAVDVVASTQGHLDFIRHLQRLYPDARVTYRLLEQSWPVRLYGRVRTLDLPPKLPTLWHNRALFDRYDAIVVPEKTSLNLKRFGVRRPKFIHTAHGAGDRATAVDKRIAQFDFALVPGPKTAQWLLEGGLIRPGHYAVGAYAKFDIVRRLRQQKRHLFANDRPTILYNPHFRPHLSSWREFGFKVLDHFAANDRYNLIFAPHVRLFSPPTEEKYAAFAKYNALPNVIVDLGSVRSIDMTYTLGADAYIGDVSSQVYEFLLSPRPCLFLNGHKADWRDNPRYLFWTLGPVVSDMAEFPAALETLLADPSPWREAQEKAVAATFDLSTDTPGFHNARLLADWLSANVERPASDLENTAEGGDWRLT